MLERIEFSSELYDGVVPLKNAGTDIRAYIDENNLHELDALKTAYSLSGVVPIELMSIFLQEEVTQEDVEVLYQQGGNYLLGTFDYWG